MDKLFYREGGGQLPDPDGGHAAGGVRESGVRPDGMVSGQSVQFRGYSRDPLLCALLRGQSAGAGSQEANHGD